MIVLDTNILSELMRPTAIASVSRWFVDNEKSVWLPTIALCEISFGVARLPTGRKRDALSESLAVWRMRLADRVLSFSSETAMIFGDIFASAERSGKPMSFADAQIAATAREHGATLATRNIKDFSTTGLRLVNPWAE